MWSTARGAGGGAKPPEAAPTPLPARKNDKGPPALPAALCAIASPRKLRFRGRNCVAPARRRTCQGGPPAGDTQPSWGCPYSRVQPQELISRLMMPLPVSMWVVQGMQGSKLRMARSTSMPLIWSSGTDSRMGVSTMACS